jgi:serine protease Do
VRLLRSIPLVFLAIVAVQSNEEFSNFAMDALTDDHSFMGFGGEPKLSRNDESVRLGEDIGTLERKPSHDVRKAIAKARSVMDELESHVAADAKKTSKVDGEQPAKSDSGLQHKTDAKAEIAKARSVMHKLESHVAADAKKPSKVDGEPAKSDSGFQHKTDAKTEVENVADVNGEHPAGGAAVNGEHPAGSGNGVNAIASDGDPTNAAATPTQPTNIAHPTGGTAPVPSQAVQARIEALESKVHETGQVNWTELMGKLGGGVVQLMVIKAQFSFSKPQAGPTPESVSGTGFFVSTKSKEFSLTNVTDEVVIVTNAHVAKDAAKIEMRHLAMNEEPTALEVIGVCSARDVALLRVKNLSKFMAVLKEKGHQLTVLEFGNSDESMPGDSVAAMGFPLGFKGLKVSVGVVSGYQVFRSSLYLQMDASINPGNSGGPLINSRGMVVGINSAGMTGATGMSFAIPSVCVKVLLNPLYTNREWQLPFVGVNYNGATAATAHFLGYENANSSISEGVYVYAVEKGSLMSDKVLPGDYITKVDGKIMDRFGQIHISEMRHSVNLFGLLARKPIRSPLTFTVWRNKKLVEVSAVYDKTPTPPVHMIDEAILEPPDFEEFAGIVFSPATMNAYVDLMTENIELAAMVSHAHSHDERIVVADVLGGSCKETKAVAAGMIVNRINHQNVTTLYSLCKALSEPVQLKSQAFKNGKSLFFVFESTAGDVCVESIQHLNASKAGIQVQGIPMCDKVINVTEALMAAKQATGNVGEDVTTLTAWETLEGEAEAILRSKQSLESSARASFARTGRIDERKDGATKFDPSQILDSDSFDVEADVL